VTPAPAPFNVFIDSDGPIADFDAALQASGLTTQEFKHRPGVYLYLKCTSGALESLETLRAFDEQNLLRVWILTKTPSSSPYAYTEKVLWYRQHFSWLEDRVILTHDKSLLGTASDMLLDDRPHKANASLFRGDFVLFDVEEPTASWAEFMRLVREKIA
jgi:hypothetical protein